MANDRAEQLRLTDLPDEVLVNVLCYLRERDIVHVMRTCHSMLAIGQDSAIWKNSYKQRWPNSVFNRRMATNDWREIYRKRLALEENWLRGRCTSTHLQTSQQTIIGLHVEGDKMIFGGTNHVIEVRDMEKLSILSHLRDHTKRVLCTKYREEHHRLISSGDDGVRIWNLEDLTQPQHLKNIVPTDLSVHTVQWRDALMACGHHRGTVSLWDIETETAIRTFKPGDPAHTSTVQGMHANEEFTTLVTGSWDNTWKIWDLRTLSLVATPKDSDPPSYITCLQWDPTKAILGTWRGTLKIFDMRTLTKITTIQKCHTSFINTLQFDEFKIVSGGNDAMVFVYDPKTFNVKARLVDVTPETVRVLRFHEDKLVCGGFKGNMAVLDFF